MKFKIKHITNVIVSKKSSTLQQILMMYNNHKLLFAPFHGITDKTYRNAFAKCFGGFDEIYAPFISGSGTKIINPSKLTDITPILNNLIKTIPQILSINADEIKLFGKTIKDNGYDSFNWNLGCPFKQIANKKRGCGILPYPDELHKLLDGIFSDLPVKMSIKTRLGYHNSDEIFKILEIANQYPIEHIIIHARIGKQFYGGDTNPEKYIECMSVSRHKLIYNGDIFNISSFNRVKSLLPKQEIWMIGRGALMNPFLPHSLKGKFFDNDEKVNMLEEFNNELLNNYSKYIKNETRLLSRMKSVWGYLSGVFENGREIFNKVKISKNTNEYTAAISNALENQFSDENQQSIYLKEAF
ncbi:MAG: tRNA-dihydrouridine synthase family protein [Bacteroidetes bacterium]|nr:tRNA-dihydrouridine synthase family protein [Bacteroidota bacterium]